MMGQSPFDPEDWDSLRQAVEALEDPSWIIKVANKLGMPVEKLLGAMPKQLSGSLKDATRAALSKALKVAVYKLNGTERQEPRYKIIVTLIGAGSGFSGCRRLPSSFRYQRL